MKKLFLISLMTMLCTVIAWAGNQPEPKPFAMQDARAAAHVAKAPKAIASVEDQLIYLDYGTTHLEFNTLQAAFDALPENSTHATVTMMSDQYVTYTSGHCVTVKQYQNVTLDLNGWTVYGTTPIDNASTSVIGNFGTLTIVDSSVSGEGALINEATNVDDWRAKNKPYPDYYNNVITNCGTLIIESGLLKNLSEGGASYVVDNQTNGNAYSPTLIINGGHLYNYFTDAIRMFVNSTTKNNTVIINGGTIEGYSAVWMQSSNANANIGNLTINGGILKSLRKCYVENECTAHDADVVRYWYASGGNTSKMQTTINGGEFFGSINHNNPSGHINVSDGTFHGTFTSSASDTKLSGGTYTYPSALAYEYAGWDYASYGIYSSSAKHTVEEWEAMGYHVTDYHEYSPSNDANKWIAIYNILSWKNVMYENQRNWILKGLRAEQLSEDENDFTCHIVPATPAVINKDTLDANNNEYELKDIEESLGEGKSLEGTIVSIVGTGKDEIEAGGDVVTVTVEAGDTVQVHGISGAAEGQLVVKDGATLLIGSGGMVSTNDTLTQIIVEPGGTVAVGVGGIEKQGDATPIEIQSTNDKSGVLLIDPNAPDSVAEALAKVVVYTRAHKDNGMEYWQQFASPVKGNTIKVTPLGELQGNHNFMTSLYSWDYATDSWVRVTDGMEEISEGVYAFRGDVVWTTSDAVLKPFAAYDLINNSHDYHGGVSYEFAGELVGNGDMALSFPENGFCTFGNSYTAPIDLVSFFETVKNDIQYDYDNNNNLIATSAIDPCVYIFNSAKNCFESVNQAAIKLWKKGIKTPAFTQIPPQQAFVMNLLKGNSGQSAVNYAASVWGNPQGQNVAIKAPKRAEETSTLSALLEITVTDGNATDRVMLIEDEEYSNEYDFGADAVKYMNGSFNLYANTTIGQLDMVATDNIENTELSFKAGNAVNYTISFNNVEGDFVLIDQANNSQVAIEEGGIYTFATQPNVTAENRFAIVPAAKMPTAIENTEVKANVKGIYTIMGQYLGEDFDVLPAGVYVIDGVKIVK